MSTPYSDIYNYFLSLVTDYGFSQMTQQDFENTAETLLNMSVAYFSNCKTDLSKRDDVNKAFINDLSEMEKLILANLMVVEYLQSKITTTDLLKMQMSDKDYRSYSQANHIKELRDLHAQIKRDTDKLIIRYSWKDAGDLND